MQGRKRLYQGACNAAVQPAIFDAATTLPRAFIYGISLCPLAPCMRFLCQYPWPALVSPACATVYITAWYYLSGKKPGQAVTQPQPSRAALSPQKMR